jgi:hypothetical protein
VTLSAATRTIDLVSAAWLDHQWRLSVLDMGSLTRRDRIGKTVDAQEILERAATIIEQVRHEEACARVVRDQRTKASVTLPHDRPRLRSSASAAAARRFTGIASSSASTA